MLFSINLKSVLSFYDRFRNSESTTKPLSFSAKVLRYCELPPNSSVLIDGMFQKEQMETNVIKHQSPFLQYALPFLNNLLFKKASHHLYSLRFLHL